MSELEHIHRPAKVEKSPAVVLFHGYGANQQDLAPLADMMDPNEEFHWFFPNGVLEIILAPGFSGRAWFQIDVAEYEAAIREGRLRDLTKSRPEGFDEALVEANSFFQNIQDRYGQVVLGGFSQGAMLAAEMAFVSNPLPAGLVLMSGSLLDQDNWKSLAPKARGLKFLQSHGENDAIVAFEGAKMLNTLMLDSGLEGQFLDFPGGHEIPPKIIDRIGSFIRERLT